MLKIEQEIKKEANANRDWIFDEFLSNLKGSEAGKVLDLVGHKFTIINCETHYENVDLEASSADEVTTTIFQLDDDKDTFYRVKTFYNSWESEEPSNWEVVVKREKTITVWEPV